MPLVSRCIWRVLVSFPFQHLRQRTSCLEPCSDALRIHQYNNGKAAVMMFRYAPSVLETVDGAASDEAPPPPGKK